MAKNFVTDYAADNTGAVDATSKLQTAVNDCSAGGQYAGQELFIPAGGYKISGNGVTCSASNLRIRGESMYSTSFLFSTPTATAGVFNFPSAAVTTSGFHFQDFTVDGLDGASLTVQPFGICVNGGTAVPSVTRLRMINVRLQNLALGGLRVAGSLDNALLQGCDFNNINTAVNPVNSSGSAITGTLTNSVLTGCTFHDTGTASNANGQSWCVYINGQAQNVTITASAFKNALGGAIQVFSGTQTTLYGIAVSGNTFSNASVAAEFGDCAGVTFCNNVAYGCGVTFTQNVRGFSAVGNTLVNSGIAVTDFGNVSASDGIISGNSIVYPDPTLSIYGTGISLYSAYNVDVFHNTVSGMAYGVTLQNVYGAAVGMRNVSIRNNRFSVPYGSTRYLPGNGFVFNPDGGRVTAGVLIGGAHSDIDIEDNRCTNMDYEVALCSGVGGNTGQPVNITFRSPTLAATNQLGILAGGTLPPSLKLVPRVTRPPNARAPYGF